MVEDTKRAKRGASHDDEDGAKTVPGAPAQPAGTIQMRHADAPPESAAPAMPTLTGSPLPDVEPPSMPGPRYEIGGEIARGGMGRVVEATDTLLGRVVALKEALSLDADVLRRFARETRITARLEHPSIVPVHDAGALPGGAPYYVMRKIGGRPLEKLVASAETLNQRLVLVPHVMATAQAVAHAHERGIVHRDIKPSNILVGELGETILIDWGLAKVIGEADDPITSPASIDSSLDHDVIKTRAGIVYGTPGFMAPEQLRGAPVNERCDVYALGATLYHLLTRKPPHHAKTADEMMKAAAREPPTPIGELVPGVPAELSTIIDKALAHDPKARYPDARALAEDLQRFLSGQLVASHRYSTRERLVRFVRMNRVPVIVVAAATLALLVGGAIAVTRVIGERDRADDAARAALAEKQIAVEERALAEQRADKLTLAEARSLVEINPTRAVALVKPLAEKHWREVRSVVAAARANGVAFSLPASKKTSTLELSRDGRRALAAGDDGVVRIYDLPKHTWRAVPSTLGPGPISARFADEERRIVLWRGTQLSVIDVATNAARMITAPTKIRDLEVVGITAYWVDDKREMWQLDLAGTAPVAIPMPERIEQLAPSPDGRWIALHGEAHLLIFDRTQPAAPPQEMTSGKIRDLEWSLDGKYLAVLVDRDAVLVSAELTPQLVNRQNVGSRNFITYGNSRIYTIGPTGVSIVARDDKSSGPRKQLTGAPVGLRVSRGGTIVAGSTGGISVLSDHGDHNLVVPVGHLDIIEAHPRSPYVIATVENRLLVWNLDEIEPRQLLDQTPGLTHLVGSNHVIASFADSGTQWIDVTTGKSVTLGPWPLHSVAASPSGQLACAIDLGHHARLVAPGREPKDLEGDVEIAGFAAEHLLLLGDGATGSIHLLDTRDGKRTVLAKSKAKLQDMAWSRVATAGGSGPWVAAMFDDSTLWRRNLATGAESSAKGITPSTHLQITSNGMVLYAERNEIRAWKPDGTVVTQAPTVKPVLSIGLAGASHLVAILEDRSAYLVDLAKPNSIVETESVSQSKIATPGDRVSVSMSAESGLMVVPTRGGIEVIDPIVPHRWTIATAPPPPNPYEKSTIAYTDPEISNDGTRVVARLPSALVAWTIVVPSTAAETGKWIDAMTNAAIDLRTSKLVWR